ncbi:MAG: acyl-CoA thioesterase [Fimbriimonadaceae bacterium]|nr:acyl-CoA thioesterase [Chitinophagales bacterium]
MTEKQKIVHSEYIVRFSDCDPFNHLNNSKYIDYFLNAREDQLMQFYNFNVYEHAMKAGCGWVVGQHEIAYLKPVNTMETVLIESLVLRWAEKDILVEFHMWNKEKTKLKAIMWTKFFYFNFATQKSELHTEELTKQFKALECLQFETSSFENRKIQILKTGE